MQNQNPILALPRFNGLDGLRAVAVLFVFFVHLPALDNSSIIGLITSIGSASKFGYLGVDIFFVLSGFLITRIIFNEMQKGKFSFTNFYMRRTLRIFPLYFLVIAICILLFKPDGVLYFLFFSGNYYFAFNTAPSPLTHTWSLAVEEQFYIIWPAIIVYLYGVERRKYYIIGIIAFAIISSLIIELSVNSELGHRLVQFSLTSRMLSLCLGGWIALHTDINMMQGKLKKYIGWMVIGLLIAYTSVFLRARVDMLPFSTFMLIGFAITSTMILNIFLYFENNTSSLFDFVFKNRIIRYIGTISYGIYVYHFIVFYFYKHNMRSVIPEELASIAYIFMCASVFIISAASYKFMEVPLLKLKKRYS